MAALVSAATSLPLLSSMVFKLFNAVKTLYPAVAASPIASTPSSLVASVSSAVLKALSQVLICLLSVSINPLKSFLIEPSRPPTALAI